MPSKIDVANRAALKLGTEWIASFADQNKFARAISLCYDGLLESELSKNRWTFAIKRATLPALAAVPAWASSASSFCPPTVCGWIG